MKTNDSKQRRTKLLCAIDLMEAAVSLMRCNIARRLPQASPEHVENELKRWLHEQPYPFVPKMPCDKSQTK